MSTTRGIRHRLLTILLLGAVTSALLLVALVQLLTTSTAQRVERAHDGVVEEAERLARDPSALAESPSIGVVGLRGGVGDVGDREGAPAALPEGWIAPVREAVAAARAEHQRVVREVSTGGGTLVVAAVPGPNGVPAWAGFLVRPLPSLRTWQWIVVLLAFATALLVATTIYAIVTVSRGATALRASLSALATDLGAPIPRPQVRELANVADGIADLAFRLARARSEEERLGRELARQERLAALGRVVAGVAHEVRNPLASIKLRLDLAAAAGALPPVADRAIGHASSEIARLDRLVADLLMVAGGATGPRASTSLGDLVTARAEALSPWAGAQGAQIVTRGDARVTLDADAVGRAIDNLLRNAVEASPPGARVEARVEARDGGAVVRVEDRGGGVADARVSELFEPFFTTKSHGTGLGLAISRAIARAHGGDVVYVRDGATTRFELTLADGRASGGGARHEAAA